MGRDCMIECCRVYYAVSYDKAIAWLYCRRTCNRTLIKSNVNTYATNCQQYVILCHDIPGEYCAHVYTWRVQQREIYSNLLLYNSDAYVVIAHPIHFPLLCFTHVFMRFCLYSAGSIRNKGEGETCHTVFLPLNQFRMFCAYVLPLL
jgi:hypothetical protein